MIDQAIGRLIHRHRGALLIDYVPNRSGDASRSRSQRDSHEAQTLRLVHQPRNHSKRELA